MTSVKRWADPTSSYAEAARWDSTLNRPVGFRMTAPSIGTSLARFGSWFAVLHAARRTESASLSKYLISTCVQQASCGEIVARTATYGSARDLITACALAVSIFDVVNMSR